MVTIVVASSDLLVTQYSMRRVRSDFDNYQYLISPAFLEIMSVLVDSLNNYVTRAMALEGNFI